MERIGIRELRQHASRWVRRAAEGESFEVTDRGRPVARLLPLPRQAAGVEQLRGDGRITTAKGDLLRRPLLEAIPGTPLPSEELRRLREDER